MMKREPSLSKPDSADISSEFGHDLSASSTRTSSRARKAPASAASLVDHDETASRTRAASKPRKLGPNGSVEPNGSPVSTSSGQGAAFPVLSTSIDTIPPVSGALETSITVPGSSSTNIVPTNIAQGISTHHTLRLGNDLFPMMTTNIHGSASTSLADALGVKASSNVPSISMLHGGDVIPPFPGALNTSLLSSSLAAALNTTLPATLPPNLATVVMPSSIPSTIPATLPVASPATALPLSLLGVKGEEDAKKAKDASKRKRRESSKADGDDGDDSVKQEDGDDDDDDDAEHEIDEPQKNKRRRSSTRSIPLGDNGQQMTYYERKKLGLVPARGQVKEPEDAQRPIGPNGEPLRWEEPIGRHPDGRASYIPDDYVGGRPLDLNSIDMAQLNAMQKILVENLKQLDVSNFDYVKNTLNDIGEIIPKRSPRNFKPQAAGAEAHRTYYIYFRYLPELVFSGGVFRFKIWSKDKNVCVQKERGHRERDGRRVRKDKSGKDEMEFSSVPINSDTTLKAVAEASKLPTLGLPGMGNYLTPDAGMAANAMSAATMGGTPLPGSGLNAAGLPNAGKPFVRDFAHGMDASSVLPGLNALNGGLPNSIPGLPPHSLMSTATSSDSSGIHPHPHAHPHAHPHGQHPHGQPTDAQSGVGLMSVPGLSFMDHMRPMVPVSTHSHFPMSSPLPTMANMANLIPTLGNAMQQTLPNSVSLGSGMQQSLGTGVTLGGNVQLGNGMSSLTAANMAGNAALNGLVNNQIPVMSALPMLSSTMAPTVGAANANLSADSVGNMLPAGMQHAPNPGDIPPIGASIPSVGVAGADGTDAIPPIGGVPSVPMTLHGGGMHGGAQDLGKMAMGDAPGHGGGAAGVVHNGDAVQHASLSKNLSDTAVHGMSRATRQSTRLHGATEGQREGVNMDSGHGGVVSLITTNTHTSTTLAKGEDGTSEGKGSAAATDAANKTGSTPFASRGTRGKTVSFSTKKNKGRGEAALQIAPGNVSGMFTVENSGATTDACGVSMMSVGEIVQSALDEDNEDAPVVDPAAQAAILAAQGRLMRAMAAQKEVRARTSGADNAAQHKRLSQNLVCAANSTAANKDAEQLPTVRGYVRVLEALRKHQMLLLARVQHELMQAQLPSVLAAKVEGGCAVAGVADASLSLEQARELAARLAATDADVAAYARRCAVLAAVLHAADTGALDLDAVDAVMLEQVTRGALPSEEVVLAALGIRGDATDADAEEDALVLRLGGTGNARVNISEWPDAANEKDGNALVHVSGRLLTVNAHSLFDTSTYSVDDGTASTVSDACDAFTLRQTLPIPQVLPVDMAAATTHALVMARPPERVRQQVELWQSGEMRAYVLQLAQTYGDSAAVAAVGCLQQEIEENGGPADEQVRQQAIIAMQADRAATMSDGEGSEASVKTECLPEAVEYSLEAQAQAHSHQVTTHALPAALPPVTLPLRTYDPSGMHRYTVGTGLDDVMVASTARLSTLGHRLDARVNTKAAVVNLRRLYRERFGEWYAHLHHGSHLLLHGFGSKIALLNEFRLSHLTDAPVVVVNGYDDGMRLKDIVSHMYAAVCESSSLATLDALTATPQAALEPLAHVSRALSHAVREAGVESDADAALVAMQMGYLGALGGHGSGPRRTITEMVGVTTYTPAQPSSPADTRSSGHEIEPVEQHVDTKSLADCTATTNPECEIVIEERCGPYLRALMHTDLAVDATSAAAAHATALNTMAALVERGMAADGCAELSEEEYLVRMEERHGTVHNTDADAEATLPALVVPSTMPHVTQSLSLTQFNSRVAAALSLDRVSASRLAAVFHAMTTTSAQYDQRRRAQPKFDPQTGAYTAAGLGATGLSVPTVQRAPRGLYVLVHNVDANEARMPELTEFLSILATVPYVHIVATCDSVTVPAVFKSAACSWVYQLAPTHAFYTYEHPPHHMLLQAQTKKEVDSGMKHVLASLTGVHRSMLALLAKKQVAAADAGEYGGLSGSEWLKLCFDAMLAASDDVFRRNIRELREQRLVYIQKDGRGQEAFYVPFDRATIETHILNQ